MKNVYIFEDHDQALKVWKKKKVRDLDLVHVDAHIDFGFPQAEPLETAFNAARSVDELKRKLEYSLAFSSFEDDFSKLVNIGNYIYPAIREGLVKDFYWVIPGQIREFKASKKLLEGTLRQISREYGGDSRISYPASDIMFIQVLGRRIQICTLSSLPRFEHRVLLDIDTDFLVIDSVKNSDNTANIGKRSPWISPEDLARILKEKVPDPEIITIAYSANGGYTPMKFRYLGDEIAFLFSPEKFSALHKRNGAAALFFAQFLVKGDKKNYLAAIDLNKAYRQADNNYGSLYLGLKKFRLAEQEFLKIKKVDPLNPGCLSGLGLLALEKKHYKQAGKYFSQVLASGNSPLFSGQRKQSLLGLAESEFRLKRYSRAKELLRKHIRLEPLEPVSRYLLAQILEKQGDLPRAASNYQDALRLGLGGLEVFCQLLKISFRLQEKESIIKRVGFYLASYKKRKRSRYSFKEKKQILFIEKSLK